MPLLWPGLWVIFYHLLIGNWISSLYKDVAWLHWCPVCMIMAFDHLNREKRTWNDESLWLWLKCHAVCRYWQCYGMLADSERCTLTLVLSFSSLTVPLLDDLRAPFVFVTHRFHLSNDAEHTVMIARQSLVSGQTTFANCKADGLMYPLLSWMSLAGISSHASWIRLA